MAMEGLQLSQVLADLSNLGAAEPQAAANIVNANNTTPTTDSNPVAKSTTPVPNTTAPQHQPQQSLRPSVLQRALSTEGPFDKFGRRIMISSTGSRTASAANSTPGTPRKSDVETEDDLDRASTLMALYDIRAKLKHQDNSSLLKAREKINALAAKQGGRQTPDRFPRTTEEIRRNRYSFPKPGL